jgi:hypothetical protein
MGMTDLMAINSMQSRRIDQFQVGDVVRTGSHVGTVMDVGTVLIAVRMATGAPRMVCPWELVRPRSGRHERCAGTRQ